jgi:hypothetical protein
MPSAPTSKSPRSLVLSSNIALTPPLSCSIRRSFLPSL